LLHSGRVRTAVVNVLVNKKSAGPRLGTMRCNASSNTWPRLAFLDRQLLYFCVKFSRSFVRLGREIDRRNAEKNLQAEVLAERVGELDWRVADSRAAGPGAS